MLPCDDDRGSFVPVMGNEGGSSSLRYLFYAAGIALLIGLVLSIHEHLTFSDQLAAGFSEPQHLEASLIESWECSNDEGSIHLMGLYLPSEYELGLTDAHRQSLHPIVRSGSGIGKVTSNHVDHATVFRHTKESKSWVEGSLGWQPFTLNANLSGSFKESEFTCESKRIPHYHEMGMKTDLIQYFSENF